jgi:predicted transcriptional regulator
MAVISVRLNTEEEKIIDYLSSVYDEDKSTLIKHSLKEMYEDIVDKKIIDDYEIKEQKKKPHFISSEEIMKDLL